MSVGCPFRPPCVPPQVFWDAGPSCVPPHAAGALQPAAGCLLALAALTRWLTTAQRRLTLHHLCLPVDGVPAAPEEEDDGDESSTPESTPARAPQPPVHTPQRGAGAGAGAAGPHLHARTSPITPSRSLPVPIPTGSAGGVGQRPPASGHRGRVAALGGGGSDGGPRLSAVADPGGGSFVPMPAAGTAPGGRGPGASPAPHTPTLGPQPGGRGAPGSGGGSSGGGSSVGGSSVGDHDAAFAGRRSGGGGGGKPRRPSRPSHDLLARCLPPLPLYAHARSLRRFLCAVVDACTAHVEVCCLVEAAAVPPAWVASDAPSVGTTGCGGTLVPGGFVALPPPPPLLPPPQGAAATGGGVGAGDVDAAVVDVGAAMRLVLGGGVGAPPDVQRAAARCFQAVVRHAAGGGVSGAAKPVGLHGLGAFASVVEAAV